MFIRQKKFKGYSEIVRQVVNDFTDVKRILVEGLGMKKTKFRSVVVVIGYT